MAWLPQTTDSIATAAAAASPTSVALRGSAFTAYTARPQATSTAAPCPSSTIPSCVSKSGSSDGARTMARSVRMTVDTPTAASSQPSPRSAPPPAGSEPRHTIRHTQAAPNNKTSPVHSDQRPAAAVPVNQREVRTYLPKGATAPTLATPTPKA